MRLSERKHNLFIATKRLELRAATRDIAEAAVSDRAQLGPLLEAMVPRTWPPSGIDQAEQVFQRVLAQAPRLAGWLFWYVVALPDIAGTRTLIGAAGFKGPPLDYDDPEVPGPARCVELGYSLLADFQGRGLATEAVEGLLNWAFSEPRVDVVEAETYPDNTASRRVLEKVGMSLRGPGIDPGTLRFTLSRASYTLRHLQAR